MNTFLTRLRGSTPWIKIWSILLLLNIATLLIFLGVFCKQSIRLDEAQSLFQTNRDFAGMIKTVGEDVHVPLYHVTIHFWQLLFGNSIEMVRVVSFIFFSATIWAVYYLGRYIAGNRVGLFAAFITALSPFMNWYASEARMYTMLSFFTSLNLLFFLKNLREGRMINWVVFTFTAVLGLYTHYFFALVLFTQLLYVWVQKARFEKQNVRRFFFSLAIAGISLTPWINYVMNLGGAGSTRPNLTAPTSQDLFNTYSQLIFGFQDANINTVVLSLWPFLVLGAFLALNKRNKLSSPLVFLLALCIIPVVVAFGASQLFEPVFLSRYLSVIVPALYVLMAWFFFSLPRKMGYWLQGAVVASMVLLLFMQVTNPRTPVKEEYAAVSQYLNQNATPQDVIIVSSPFTVYPIEYHYKGASVLTTLPAWNRFEAGSVTTLDPNKIQEEAQKANSSYENAWVVLSYDQGYLQDVRSYYEDNYMKVYQHEFSPNLILQKYKLRYDPEVKVSSVAETANTNQ